MKEKNDTNGELSKDSSSHFPPLRVVLLTTVKIIVVMAASLALFLYTPVIRWFNIVGYGKMISEEVAFGNILASEDNVDMSERLFRYFMNEQQDNLVSHAAIVDAISKVDSLSNEVELWRAYSLNIIEVMNGKKKPMSVDSIINRVHRDSTKDIKNHLDSILRNDIRHSVTKLEREYNRSERHEMNIPMKGEITIPFDYLTNQLGVLITNRDVTPVTAPANGTVLSVLWSHDEGYTMVVQHNDNIISIYKGMTKATKNIGSHVTNREVIGYAGVRNGLAELEFQIWDNGNAVDPEKYILF